MSIRIGLVVTYSLDYCRGILRGVKRYAEAKPEWMFVPIEPDPDGLRLLQEVRPAGVIAHLYDRALAAALLQLERPLVNVSGVLDDLPVCRIGPDDLAVGRMAAAHFLDRGFRSFGFAGHRNHAYSQRREQGFREGVTAAGWTVRSYHEPENLAFRPHGRLWALERALLDWVSHLPKPTALFACNDQWGLQLSEVCHQRGLRMPEDVAILGVQNDDLLCELARPSLSIVAVAKEKIGWEAAALLDRLLAGGPRPAAPLLIPPTEVVCRRSSDTLAVEDGDVVAAVQFIRQNCQRPLSVDQVLAVVAVSRRTLERRFQQTLNRGVWQEIRRAHLERAKRLLLNTDLPMAGVARRAGFSDQKQLSVIFKQETRLTPTAFRRLFRADGARADATSENIAAAADSHRGSFI